MPDPRRKHSTNHPTPEPSPLANSIHGRLRWLYRLPLVLSRHATASTVPPFQGQGRSPGQATERVPDRGHRELRGQPDRRPGGPLHRRWHRPCDVPVTELWFVEGTDYLGTVIIRHRLTRPWSAKAAMLATTSYPAIDVVATPPKCSPRPSRCVPGPRPQRDPRFLPRGQPRLSAGDRGQRRRA